MKEIIKHKIGSISFGVPLLEEIKKICDITGDSFSSFVRNACMNEISNFWDRWNKNKNL